MSGDDRDDRPDGGRVREGGAPPAAPPHRVRVPVNVHDWENISFLHWPVDAAVLARRLPDELAVLTNEGAAWVGVTPFFIRVRPPRLPAVHGVTAFPETNVRTYVRGPDGVPGVWFLSLDAARTDAVITARFTHRLPYMRARMAVAVEGAVVRYRSRRLWPHARAELDATIRVGGAIPASEVSDQETFLTARYCLYTVVGGTVRRAWAEHEPWPLQRAEPARLRQGLVRAAGLPDPDGAPVTHFSPGVTVRVGPLEGVAAMRGAA
jgi:uncharacterized protein